jgi:hypothetical protein
MPDHAVILNKNKKCSMRSGLSFIIFLLFCPGPEKEDAAKKKSKTSQPENRGIGDDFCAVFFEPGNAGKSRDEEKVGGNEPYDRHFL